MAKLAAALFTFALLFGAPPSLASECDQFAKAEGCEVPWYRGTKDSKFRLRFDLGPASISLKGPKRKGRIVELRFVIRF